MIVRIVHKLVPRLMNAELLSGLTSSAYSPSAIAPAGKRLAAKENSFSWELVASPAKGGPFQLVDFVSTKAGHHGE